jgi:hypothetical protein
LLCADHGAQLKACELVASQIGRIGWYFGTLIVFSYLLPWFIRFSIQYKGADCFDAPLQKWLRFTQAPWYYLLSGADFSPGQKPDCIAISSVVNVSGKPYLYVGHLHEYFFGPRWAIRPIGAGKGGAQGF